MMLEEDKENINKFLNEIQGNMNKLEALTMETQKSLKEIQENMSQQKPIKRKHKNHLKKCKRN